MHSLPFERNATKKLWDGGVRRGREGWDSGGKQESGDRPSSTSSSPEASSMLEEKFISKRPHVTVKKSVFFFPKFFNCTQKTFIYSLWNISCSLRQRWRDDDGDADFTGQRTNFLADSPVLTNDSEMSDYHHRGGIDLFSTAFLAVCRTFSVWISEDTMRWGKNNSDEFFGLLEEFVVERMELIC